MKKLKMLAEKISPMSRARFNSEKKLLMHDMEVNRKGFEEILEKILSNQSADKERHELATSEIVSQIKGYSLQLGLLQSHIEESISYSYLLQSQLAERIAEYHLLLIQLNERVNQLEKSIANFNKSLGEKNEANRKSIKNVQRVADEIRWAFIFNNTIGESKWLTEQSISLGGWALGYPGAYALYRVLDDFKPKKILELGLGQSSKIIAQYVLAHEDVIYDIVEHDESWIDFFSTNSNLSSKIRITHCNWFYSDYEGVSNIRQFEGFSEKFSGQKFDLIFIDAPLSGDMHELARVDILKLLPECLEKSFVIMIDDCNRRGETNSFNRMKEKIEEVGIEYQTGRYSGLKDVRMICSLDVKYLRSL